MYFKYVILCINLTTFFRWVYDFIDLCIQYCTFTVYEKTLVDEIYIFPLKYVHSLRVLSIFFFINNQNIYMKIW